jgi:ribosomal protein L7/L12
MALVNELGVIKEAVSADEAKAMKDRLEENGAVIELA